MISVPSGVADFWHHTLMVVGPGVAPGLPACRAGVVTGSLADEIGCQGRTRTYISPINNRPLDY